MNKFNKDYYENGKKLGISLYEEYKWIPELTIPFCKIICNRLSINKNNTILDYGCAKGFMVKAFTIMGYKAYGVDISEYAINNCDPEIKDKLKLIKHPQEIKNKFTWIIAKDVLEHIEYKDLEEIIKSMKQISKNLFVIIPLAKNKTYIIPDYEKDCTHIIKEDVEWWVNTFQRCGFEVSDFHYKIKGMKDKWNKWDKGNGFFTLKNNSFPLDTK